MLPIHASLKKAYKLLLPEFERTVVGRMGVLDNDDEEKGWPSVLAKITPDYTLENMKNSQSQAAPLRERLKSLWAGSDKAGSDVREERRGVCVLCLSFVCVFKCVGEHLKLLCI